MQWDKATDIILIASIAILGVFACLGLYQWISRKSLKKVDKNLILMVVPLILMAITYIIFDKVFVLNVRPNGSGEASFPSTHAMVVATIFLLVAQNLKYYVKSKALRIILIIVMLALTTLTCFGRVLSNMHWLSDVLGGLAFALIFNAIYFIITKKGAKNE